MPYPPGPVLSRIGDSEPALGRLSGLFTFKTIPSRCELISRNFDERDRACAPARETRTRPDRDRQPSIVTTTVARPVRTPEWSVDTFHSRTEPSQHGTQGLYREAATCQLQSRPRAAARMPRIMRRERPYQYRLTTCPQPSIPHMTLTQRLSLAGTQLLPPRDASAQFAQSGSRACRGCSYNCSAVL